jgi:outer membrane protein OmpA-like peptidoglycan-associated protein
MTAPAPSPGRHLPTRIALAGAVVVLAVLGVRACAQPVRELGCAEVFARQRPGNEGGPSARPAARATVVLIDRTDSMRTGGGVAGTRGAPDLPAGLEPVIEDAVDAGDLVAIGAFDGSDTTVAWERQQRFLSTGRSDPNRQRRQEARDDLVRCLDDEVRRVSATPAQDEGTNVLGALGAARELLSDVEANGRRIVVATDGLANRGCADVGAPPEDPVRECSRTRELPHLEGTEVRFVGLGQTAGPALSLRQRNWLSSFWMGLCQAATGRPCPKPDTVPPATAPPPGTTPAVADPWVKVPDLQIDQDGATITFVIPNAVLFETDSAKLSAQATPVLAEVKKQLQEQLADHPTGGLQGTRIDVQGHTDSRGPSAYNAQLSQRRAAAVRAALLAGERLAAPVTMHGFGEEHPRCQPELRPDNTPIASNMACNRRVEIVMTVPRP